jgi:hypothetical protein
MRVTRLLGCAGAPWPPWRRRSADARIDVEVLRDQGKVISLANSDSDGLASYPAVDPPPLPCAISHCFSDPGAPVHRSRRLSLDFSSSSEDSSSSGDGGGLAARAEQSRGVLAALFDQLVPTPEHEPGHIYWEDAGEPEEYEIAGSWDASDGDGSHEARPRGSILDDAAGSDGDISGSLDECLGKLPMAGMPAAVASGQRRRKKLHRALFQASQGVPSGAVGSHGGASTRLQIDVQHAGSSVSAEDSDVKDDAALLDSDVSADSGSRRQVVIDDSSGSQSGDRQTCMSPIAENSTVKAGWHGDGRREDRVAPVTAVTRRRERRLRSEAEMKDLDPAGYEKVMAVRQALAPYGWDKCGAAGNAFHV